MSTITLTQTTVGDLRVSDHGKTVQCGTYSGYLGAVSAYPTVDRGFLADLLIDGHWLLGVPFNTVISVEGAE